MRFPAVYLGLFVAFALPARAQVPRFEGTLTQTGDGAPLRANLSFQAPDSLKIEVLGSQNEVVQVVVASENQTQTFDARTKRVGVLGANIAREWFRGAGFLAGGPANFAFTGATGFTAQSDQGITRVRDRVLLGNDERRSYYVASKQRVRAFPFRIEIANGIRTDFDDLQNVLSRAKITLDAGKLPLRADVGSGKDIVSFAYALKPRATEFPAGFFALPEVAKDAIREEDSLKAPSSYADASPDDLWNHGLSLWRATGDSSGALALWARATLANPRATAPRFSSLDVALATRASSAAARALEGLKPLLGEADFAWVSAPLDELRADRPALLRDLQKASSTGAPERKLALSLALRAMGDLNGARATWKQLLSPLVPHVVATRAAENFALSATRAELPILGQTLEGDDEEVRLARALLDLRGGKTSSATFETGAFRASFARALERAGKSEAARPLWESLEKSDSVGVQNEARAHLITILARAGDASAALVQWNRWNATLAFDTQKSNAQNVLFDAFSKAGKTDALRVLLSNRAVSTGAKDLDLRLSLAFQESFGSDQDVANARSAGFDRFSTVPFWLGKRAESLVSQGFFMAPIDDVGFRKRTLIFKQANDLLTQAIAGASEPTFFQLQKSLIQVQRATNVGGVLDPIDATNAEAAGRAELARLDANSDPDFQVVAALGWNAFPAPEDRMKTLASARRALDSAPVDGDRTTLVFAARQATARVLERAGDVNGATKEWATLLDISQNADDEAGLVANLLNGMERRKNPEGMAQLLVRVAGEHWSLDANSALLSGTAGRVAASPLAPEIIENLDTLAERADGSNATKGAIIARAALGQARLERANAIIAVPGSPPAADAELERATRALTPALSALKVLGEENDPFWTTRARLLLLDSGTLSANARRDVLQKLVEVQSGEPSIVLALANTDTTPTRRMEAAQTLDFRLETWRRLALDALTNGDKENSDLWSGEAFEFASSAPEVDATSFQGVAFARAKVLWANGQTPTATTLYNSLASVGWNPIARATALLALRKRLQEAGRDADAKAVEARIKALALDKDSAQSALSLLEELDG